VEFSAAVPEGLSVIAVPFLFQRVARGALHSRFEQDIDQVGCVG
jgi:hypothetical protein